MNIASVQTLQIATSYLSKSDLKLKKVIKTSKICTLKPHKNYYQELVESIIGQQLSVKAARSIRSKFLALFNNTFPNPKQIINIPIADLRKAGLSNAKCLYIKDLATHIENGQLNLNGLDKLNNHEIILKLTAVKGIGEWTAHMFLMFAMGRLDVLAHGDLGIKNGIQKLYSLKKLPSPQEIYDISLKYKWHPYESVACWYIWEYLDND